MTQHFGFVLRAGLTSSPGDPIGNRPIDLVAAGRLAQAWQLIVAERTTGRPVPQTTGFTVRCESADDA
jgi:hypothetical protein